jgi:RHS repeat-associated protein
LIVQENHYDLWGMNLVGIEKQGRPDHKFQYNGKEKQEELGRHWNDYSARFYDPQLGRWHSVDPKSDEGNQESQSPFHYGFNNPVNAIDPDGRFPILPIIWAAYEIGSAIYDGYQAYQTVTDKNASTGEKWVAVGGNCESCR